MKRTMLAAALIVTCTTSPVHADETSSAATWAVPVVTVQLHPNIGKSWQARRMIRSWNAAGSIHLTITYSTCVTNCIVVKRKRPPAINPEWGGVAWAQQTDGVISHCDVNLNTSVTNWPVARAHIIAHEIGHCLGLPHSDDPNSVMYSSGYNIHETTEFDLNNLRTLYTTRSTL